MEYIHNQKIQIFSKSWCPYCTKAKQLLMSYETINPSMIELCELDLEPNGKEIQKHLALYTHQKTVPYIFFYTKFIGGYTELATLHTNHTLLETIEMSRSMYKTVHLCNVCGKPSCKCSD